MTQHSIYALCDPNTGDVRYVGSTSTSLYQRRCEHISAGQSTPPKAGTPKLREWIKSLLNVGEKPIITLLAECPAEHAKRVEKEWIAFYHNKGCNLLNVHGVPGPRPRLPERVYHLRMPAELAARFDLMAQAKFTSRSALMRELVARETETFFANHKEAA